MDADKPLNYLKPLSKLQSIRLGRRFTGFEGVSQRLDC